MEAMIQKKMSTQWSEREKLRDAGQFWTPAWVAEAMVTYVAQDATEILDPGAGIGAFYVALKALGRNIPYYGIDIDSRVLAEGRTTGVFDHQCALEVRDFILNPPRRLFKGIVANPPYIRHHRLLQETKQKLRELSLRAIGGALDGRAGLHVYFLIQALQLLDYGGRLAFIVPADICEGVFAKKLWNWIAKRFRIDGVVTFDYEATPFPGVDTNAMILLIRHAPPSAAIRWMRCHAPSSHELARAMIGERSTKGKPGAVTTLKRDLSEALAVGFSRPPMEHAGETYTLGDFARVMRGVVTGANEFFFLTRARARELGIPDRFLRRAIGRTRDVDGDAITVAMLDALERKGRPTFLFNPNGFPPHEMPSAVRAYLASGERMGLPSRVLIATRKPWYRMEERVVPPFLFAYLGRRNVRFIRNAADIVPLTSFLCVYPRSEDPKEHEKLWRILQHPSTVDNLKFVGKSYGSGAIKVEPRALERLPIRAEVVDETALEFVRVPPLSASISVMVPA